MSAGLLYLWNDKLFISYLLPNILEIKQNISLKKFNTFGIEVNAKYFVEILKNDDWETLFTENIFTENEKLFLGGGSNILLTKNFEGIAVHIATKGIQKIEEKENDIYIKASAGETWNNLVMFCVENMFYGIENLSLIPGSCGAAPMQNIGAYGSELKDVFFLLEAIEISTGKSKIFYHDDCKFGYRNSVFKHELKNKFIITSITLKLQKSAPLKIEYGDIKKTLEERNITIPVLKDVSDAVIYIRQSKLPNPLELGNAGSFFKNPEIPIDLYTEIKKTYSEIPQYRAVLNNHVKVPAAWLIEQCGWKGKRIGNTGSHIKQPLVLVNYGDASGTEILLLAKEIIGSVKEKFDIELNPEVNII